MSNYVVIRDYGDLIATLIASHSSKVTSESFEQDWKIAKLAVRKRLLGTAWGLKDIYCELANMGWLIQVLDTIDIEY